MVYQTRGIILHKFMHDDNKMIVKIYTELYGTHAYLCFRSSASKRNSNFFLPMSLVDMTAERKKGNFDYVKDLEVLANVNLGEYNIAVSSVSMFLNEILYKLLFDAGEDKSLFEFLFSSLQKFFTQKFIPDFHLRFLTALMRELGSLPENNYTQGMVFNIEKSCFSHVTTAKKEEQMLGFYFQHLLNQDLLSQNQEEIVPYIFRNSLLNMILNYYTLHIADLSNIKSHEILRVVLH